MREILFRGKRKNNGKWVEGSLLAFADGDTFICTFNDEIVEILNKYEVVPETVGQYTGLKDKNDTKIFEGDIIRDTTDNELLTVEGTTAFGFDFKYVAGEDSYVNAFDIGIDDDNTYLTSSIIIGNIHDNPELLEVE